MISFLSRATQLFPELDLAANHLLIFICNCAVNFWLIPQSSGSPNGRRASRSLCRRCTLACTALASARPRRGIRGLRGRRAGVAAPRKRPRARDALPALRMGEAVARAREPARIRDAADRGGPRRLRFAAVFVAVRA